MFPGSHRGLHPGMLFFFKIGGGGGEEKEEGFICRGGSVESLFRSCVKFVVILFRCIEMEGQTQGIPSKHAPFGF